jgi:hypothetical protein
MYFGVSYLVFHYKGDVSASRVSITYTPPPPEMLSSLKETW